MRKIHEYLSSKLGWYARWHTNVIQTPLHFLVLLLVAFWAGSFLYDNIAILAEGELMYSAVVMSQNEYLSSTNLLTGQPMNHELSSFGSHSQLTDLNTEVIEKGVKKIKVKLPDGPTVVLNLKNTERRGLGNLAWRGAIDGKEDSQVVITLKNGFLAGTITTNTDVYEIRPFEGKKHVIEKMDPTLFPAEIDDAVVPKLSSDIASGDTQVAPVGSTASDGVTQIDLLSVYTPQAKAAAGGSAQIDTTIQAAVDYANTAFINSQINAHYNLVATAEVAHNDSGSISTDLDWVDSDPTVANLRNQYAADMVSIIVETSPTACGMGWVMRKGQVSSSFAPYAFQATARGCAVGNLTFAHEHGHNIGMEHDPVNGITSTSASYPWSFGHYTNGVYRTVMAYAASCSSGCTRAPYFSNPNVSYLGYPTGIADQRDNARTANLTTPIVATFRGSVTSPTIPLPPSSLVASAVSSAQINLVWVDNSSDEVGFKIERSLDGVNFGLIATVGTNVVNYSNTGLTANTTYFYRVKSYSSAGDSSPSNVGSVTTNGIDTILPVVAITNNKVANKAQYNITASATDNVAVKTIQIVVGGKVKKTCTYNPPIPTTSSCSASIKSNTLTNGIPIIVNAVDTSNNIGSATATVVK